MARLPLSLLPLLASAASYAQQAAKTEAPVEQAGALTVVIFLLLFFGSIGGYIVYLWWSRQHAKDSAADE